MRAAATTHTVTDSAIASRVTAVSQSWTFCLFAIRAHVQQAFATRKHHHLAPVSHCSSQPNRTFVMLVESDVQRGVLP